jgi:Skp family chaperone for outer membrane proteins
LFFCAVVGALLPAQQMAAQEEPLLLRPAVIDLDLIRREAAVAKDVRTQIAKYHEAFLAENKKDEESLRVAGQELSRKRTILAPDAFAEERRKFEQYLEEVQRAVQKRKRDLDRVQEETMRKFGAVLTKVIAQLAQERKLTLILRKDQTFLVAKKLNITADVLKRLDEQLPTLKVPPPGK